MLKWPNSPQSWLLYRSSVISSQERRPFSFDILNPLSKIKGAETQDLFSRWLGVFHLLEVVVNGMEQSLVQSQLKFHLMCSVKDMSENYWTNLCSSLED